MPDRFCAVDIAYFRAPPSLTVYFTTDTPCHLWFRSSSVPIKKHVKPSYRRGGTLVDDPVFCFVEFGDLEQIQPGDTTDHTFLITTWLEPSFHWFLFFGSFSGVFSLCTSAIYHYAYVVFYTFKFLEDWTWLTSQPPPYWAVQTENWDFPWEPLP